MSLSILFLVVAVILFIVAAIGIPTGKVNTGWAGLAFSGSVVTGGLGQFHRVAVRYTELAPLAPQCFGCKKTADGTLVLCHRNLGGWGLMAGFGIKSLALSGAILCADCHQFADGKGRRDASFWELAHHRTLTWAWSRGFITFHKDGGPADEFLR